MTSTSVSSVLVLLSRIKMDNKPLKSSPLVPELQAQTASYKAK